MTVAEQRGREAYAAYGAATGLSLPAWADLEELTRAAWVAVARVAGGAHIAPKMKLDAGRVAREGG